MISALTAFIMGVTIVVAVTPMVRRLALDVGAVDSPADQRRVHSGVIPRLGGVAIVLGFFLPLLILFGIETEVARRFFASPLHIVGLAAGGLVVTGLGVFDDVRGVSAWKKLAVQLLAATIAYACGFRISAIAVPGLGHLEMGIFALPVTALWITAIVNAINLIDGLDGLAGGVAFFACVTNFVVGALNHDVLVMLLSASLGGAILGFLLFNFNPASIFMGDSGSLFLGYVLATTSILGNYVKSSTTVAILVPLIALGLPIMDTLFAMVRRFLERRPIFSPDRGHIHHRLLAMGINHRRAVFVLYGLSILFTAGAILVAMGRHWQIGTALLVLSVAVVGVVRAMGDLQGLLRRFRQHERLRDPASERLRTVVPATLGRVAATHELGELADVLRELGSQAELATVELAGSAQPGLSPFLWQRAVASRIQPGTVSTKLALPSLGARAYVRFEWASESRDVSPEAEILLQLVADACDQRIGRAAAAVDRVARRHLRPV